MALFSNIRSSGTADTFGLGNTENTNPALSEVNGSVVLITASNRLGRFRNHVVWKFKVESFVCPGKRKKFIRNFHLEYFET